MIWLTWQQHRKQALFAIIGLAVLGMAIPGYAVTGRDGPDHAPRFKAEVRIPGRKPAAGEGTSKRLAEQAAATVFLLREKVWQENGEQDVQ